MRNYIQFKLFRVILTGHSLGLLPSPLISLSILDHKPLKAQRHVPPADEQLGHVVRRGDPGGPHAGGRRARLQRRLHAAPHGAGVRRVCCRTAG